MTQILSARPIVDQQLEQLKNRCLMLKQKGVTPKLAVILVGNNQASLTYIGNKKKFCEQIEAEFELVQFPETIKPTEFRQKIDQLNSDPRVHGIIVQMPVAGECGDLPLTSLVAPHKDVDGFHPKNTSELYDGVITKKTLLPCTPKGIITLLDHYKIPISGKHAVVIGRSSIVGRPVSLLLLHRNATVTIAHSKTQNLVALTQSADIIVSAVGKINVISAEHIDPKRGTVVIDVGMNRTSSGKLCGDVDAEGIRELVAGHTPVPGGVGPLTVLSLMENLMLAAENQHQG